MFLLSDVLLGLTCVFRFYVNFLLGYDAMSLIELTEELHGLLRIVYLYHVVSNRHEWAHCLAAILQHSVSSGLHILRRNGGLNWRFCTLRILEIRSLYLRVLLGILATILVFGILYINGSVLRVNSGRFCLITSYLIISHGFHQWNGFDACVNGLAVLLWLDLWDSILLLLGATRLGIILFLILSWLQGV
jgi:hypothetical protein